MNNSQKQDGKPTVRAAASFNPQQDAEVLRKAMKGFGTDEVAIIRVLTQRSNAQRQEIARSFRQLYAKDLVGNLKSELSGNLENLMVALMTPLTEFLAKELHDAMAGIGTNEKTIIEIVSTASNAQMKTIKQVYGEKYGKPLENDIKGDTSGSFCSLLMTLCQGNRDEKSEVNNEVADKDAKILSDAVVGHKKVGILRTPQIGSETLGEESAINEILSYRNHSQLRKTFEEFERLTGQSFDKAIKNELSGDLKNLVLAIHKSVTNRHGFFAERLYDSMVGFGTRDRDLIRVVVSRSEIDLVDIKQAFQSQYNKTLESMIEGDTSGDYRRCLLGLVSA